LTVLNEIVDDIAQLQTDVSQNDAAIGSLQTTVSGLPTAVEFAALESSLEINTDSILLGVREFSYALFSDNDEFITADGDTFAFVDNGDVIGLIRYNESLIEVESDRIDLKVREIGSATAIGVLSSARSNGLTYTQILIDDRTLAQDISLRDGDNLRLFNDNGQSEQVTVNGDQTLTKGNSSIQVVTIESKTMVNSYLSETSHLSFPGYQLGSEINLLKDEIVLKVDSNGDIAFIRLDGSADAGTEITINADQITLEGQATFLSNLEVQGFTTISLINKTIRSATEPTVRTNGDPLVEGDFWIDTDDGDKPYTWNGSVWVAQYTIIDGGNITTGTIDASVVTVDNLDASNITTGTLSADRIGADSIDASKIDVADLFSETITITGQIRDSSYNPGVSGFAINNDGSAEFNDITVRGTVEATSGSLSGLDITGDLTMDSSGSISITNSISISQLSGGAGAQISGAVGSIEMDAQEIEIQGTGSGYALLSNEAGYVTIGSSSGVAVGFFGSNGVIKQTINSTTILDAIESLADKLNSYGLITDSLNIGDDFYWDTDTLYVDASTDRVGINTSTPSYSLEVNGTATVTGDFRFNSNISVNGTNGLTQTIAITESGGTEHTLVFTKGILTGYTLA
jgi:hypothetical protein